jgi:hypothetical protein
MVMSLRTLARYAISGSDKYLRHIRNFRRHEYKIVLWKIAPATENRHAKGAARPEASGRHHCGCDHGCEDSDRRNRRETKGAFGQGPVWKGWRRGEGEKAKFGGTIGYRQEGGGRALGMISSLAIANEFLERAQRERRPLTHMQLQKLVYLAHGWNLAVNGRPLIEDEIEAWDFGPVIRRLYDALSRYGANSVTRLIRWGDDGPVQDENPTIAQGKIRFRRTCRD